MRKTEFIKKLSKEQKQARIRILELSHEGNTSHIGSCFTAIDILLAIYSLKRKDERFILSAGHAGAALYVVLEKYKYLKNPSIEKLHVHPDRNIKLGIDASSGSLGQGLPIALGMALSNRKKAVYCLVSDGETPEGSIWESLRIAAEQNIDNLKIIVNVNGFGGYDVINKNALIKRLKSFGSSLSIVDGHNIEAIKKALARKVKNTPLVIIANTTVNQLPFLSGQDAHYKVMTNEDYKKGLELLQ